MSQTFVHLLWEGEPVGTAALFRGTGSDPRREIHGYPLRELARPNEDLVAVYNVQIYQEYEDYQYGFKFRGFEPPPEKLGDLNVAEKCFTSIIAWDLKQTLPNPHGSRLGNEPVAVSREEFSRAKQDVPTSNRRRFDVFREEEEMVDDFLGTDDPTDTNNLLACTEEAVAEVFETMAPMTDVENATHSAGDPMEDEDEEAVIDLTDNGPDEDDLSDPFETDEIQPVQTSSAQYADPGPSVWSRSGEEDSSAERTEANPNLQPEDTPSQWTIKELKRPYIYRARQKAPHKEPSMLRARRLQLSRRADNPFLRLRKCCKAQCFRKVDRTYCFAKYKKLMAAGPVERKQELIRLLNPDSRKYRFDGINVCVAFLEKGFGFSRDLQTSVKRTPAAKVSGTAARMPRDVKGDTKADFIQTYLEKIANETGDNMPHREQVQLPIMRKKEIFKEFKEHVRREHPRGSIVPSLGYFYFVWRKFCRNIKTHRHHIFTVCGRCEDLRSQIEDNMANERLLNVLVSQRREHLRMVQDERRGYASRRDKSITRPSSYYSIIVDGADQKSYGIPHFTRTTKNDTGYKLKVRCIGVLEHLREKRLHLMTMTHEFQSGANHIIEAIHRVVGYRKEQFRKLPPVFYVQVDNCTRENKNRYIFAYFELLVAKGVFKEVQVSFLPIGHTHADIDQSFSSVSTYLKANKALTMNELISGLGECYSPRAMASEMDRVANFSDLCEQSNCLTPTRPFTQFRYFRFTKVTDIENQSVVPVKCHVKVQFRDEWRELQTASSLNSFLQSLPDLTQTPDTITNPPDDIVEINRHLNSVEERIRNPDKMRELHELKNRVYTQRTDSFHWDLRTAFELNGDYRFDGEEQDSDHSSEPELDAANNFEYEENSFVAVKPDLNELSGSKFWIARILRNEQHNMLRIRWYIAAEGARSEFEAKYEPATVLEEITGRHVPFYDSIDKATIVVYFEKLSAASKLYMATKRAIRSALDLN